MPPGLRERKKAKLRNQIAETTKELIIERGYDDTTVEEIARRVEISTPTFYNYFAGKDAVLGHIAVEQYLGWASLITDQLKSDESTAVKLRVLAARNASGIVEYPKLFKAITLHATFDPIDEATERKADRSIDNSWIELLREGQKKGEITNEHTPEILDIMIRGVLFGLKNRWARGELSDDEFKAASEAAVAVLMNGMKLR